MRALRGAVQGDVRTDAVSRVLYSTDASIYQVEPYGVLIPRTVDDVRAAVTLAAEHGVPVLARGGGTSLAGQAVNAALVIDATRHLDKVVEINREERWVRAQPGISLGTLNAQLKPLGLKFGPDPASGSRAALGGVVGNNSSGSHSILYGMTADHVLSTDEILADGSHATFAPRTPAELAALAAQTGTAAEIERRMLALVNDPVNLDVIRTRTPRHWRRCGGYNLDRLTDGQGLSFRWPYDDRFNLAKVICGAEGTLGFMTEVKLNLVEVPKLTGLSVVHFDSLRPALEAVPLMLEVEPTAIELVDRHWLKLVENAPQYARLMDLFLQGRPECILITEFYGATVAEIEAQQRRLADHLRRHHVPVTAITELADPTRIQAVWKVREAGFGILMGMRGDVKPLPIVDDAAVPPDHLADYITHLEDYCCQTLGHEVSYFAHASAGCLHVHSLLNLKLATDVAKLPEIVTYAGGLLRQYGGVLSSEHGDGRLRSWLNPEFFGPELYGLFKQVKTIFDPNNLFNPGDIVDAPAMTEHLRFGQAYRALPIKPLLDFTPEQGFDRAVELCNGTATCRQLTGTMCPTFKATRDEQHTTRGRANVLRAAISGAIAFDAPAVVETLDLCVSCKACKTECPSVVDMARLKAEYQGQYYRTHALPLRSQFFARFADLSGLAAGPLAPVANAVLQNPLARGLVNRVLRLAPERQLPRFVGETFDAWARRRPAPASRPDARPLVLI
ncbi:MAG TPA: FAD-linked oxidase C-terminal domain-containing protein, partial [Anaerolineales bacterium]|nr:FAD-linked oxidase C-terminal domain-containing protein [Anaerolineales bacterium]